MSRVLLGAIADVAVAVAAAVWCRLSGTDLCLGSRAAAGISGVAVGGGSTTVVTRNRDNLGADWLAGKKPVGEQLLDMVIPRRWPAGTPAPAVLTNDDDEPSDDDDGGGVIGEVVALWDMVAIGLVSRTRDTWKRLRDGDGVGDGMGLGAGERRRPPDLRSPGFNNRRSLAVVVLGVLVVVVVLGVPAWWAVTSAGRMPGQVSEILRELRCELCTRLLIAVVRTGSGFGGFSLRAHCARMLCTMRE